MRTDYAQMVLTRKRREIVQTMDHILMTAKSNDKKNKMATAMYMEECSGQIKEIEEALFLLQNI